MNVLSCFDGMSCGQLALNKLGVKIDNYFASEIKPHAIKVTQSNFPNTIQLGDITKVNGHSLPKIDLLLAGSPCFVANTKVLTIEGYKNIQDVVIGDLVLSHTGNWRKVLNVGGTIAPTRIIKGYGFVDIETTDEHPFYVKDILDDTFVAPSWSPAKDLDNNTLCSIVTLPRNYSPANYDKWYEAGKLATTSMSIPIEVLCNSIFNIQAFLDGYFEKCKLGDIILNNSVEFSLTLQLLITTANKKQCNIISEHGSINEFGYFHDIYAWLPVKSNIITNETKPVYNIEVEIDNSYTVNNIVVHNCKDLSAANKTRDGLAGEKSGLFYEFVRLLKETNPTYFLLENVKMDKKWEDEISNILGVKPIIIDSALVTGASRKRLYWTNIPQYDSIADSHVNLQELLDSGYTDRNKARCLLESDSRPSATPVKMFHRYYGTRFTTLIFKDEQHYYDCKNHYDSNYKGLAAKDIECDSNVYEGVRYLTKKERERLQTVPVGYCKDLTENEAASLLGDGWTVDVIVHLLKNMVIQ